MRFGLSGRGLVFMRLRAPYMRARFAGFLATALEAGRFAATTALDAGRLATVLWLLLLLLGPGRMSLAWVATWGSNPQVRPDLPRLLGLGSSGALLIGGIWNDVWPRHADVERIVDRRVKHVARDRSVAMRGGKRAIARQPPRNQDPARALAKERPNAEFVRVPEQPPGPDTPQHFGTEATAVGGPAVHTSPAYPYLQFVERKVLAFVPSLPKPPTTDALPDLTRGDYFPERPTPPDDDNRTLAGAGRSNKGPFVRADHEGGVAAPAKWLRPDHDGGRPAATRVVPTVSHAA